MSTIVTKKPPERLNARTKLLEVGVEQRDRVIRMLASNDTEDRHGDTIDPSGWQLDDYNANPVILWGHDKSALPIGKAINASITQRGLELSIQFPTADQYQFAATVYELIKGGFLNAGSVGFMPMDYTLNDNGGFNFLKQSLLEFSIVTIPSNPDALVLAKSAGIDLRPIAKSLESAAADQNTELRTALSLASKETPKGFSIHRARLQARVNVNRANA